MPRAHASVGPIVVRPLRRAVRQTARSTVIAGRQNSSFSNQNRPHASSLASRASSDEVRDVHKVGIPTRARIVHAQNYARSSILRIMLNYVLCLILGLVAGISSGIFGIGGGIIIVPALILMFQFSQQKAQGTSLVALLAPVGILAVMNYWKANNADLVFGGLIAAGYLGGAYYGSKFALSVSSDELRRYFGIFMICLGVLFVTKRI